MCITNSHGTQRHMKCAFNAMLVYRIGCVVVERPPNDLFICFWRVLLVLPCAIVKEVINETSFLVLRRCKFVYLNH